MNKKNSPLFFAFLILFLAITIPITSLVPEKIKAPESIRVLLAEHDAQTRSEHTISSQNGMLLYNSKNPEKKGLFPHNNLKISLEGNKIFIQNKEGIYRPLKDHEITIVPCEKYLSLDGHAYQGTITIIVDKNQNKALFINRLNLDDYVCAVLLSESLQAWPDKMQEIQAIISRTYALYQIEQTKMMRQYKTKKSLKNKRTKEIEKPYDLKNTNVHQTYMGAHFYANLHRAVAKTSGLVLTHHHHVICSMFDTCCGGVIPAHIKNPSASFNVAPYLARNKPCTYCNSYKFYRWEHKFTLNTLLDSVLRHPDLNPKIKPIGKLTNLLISKKDKAGIAEKIKLVGKRNNYEMTARYLKNCLGNKIKSYAFSSKCEGNRIILSGKGGGHHLGLCQYGAREMIKRGWSLKKIFEFYYPGTKLAHLTNSKVAESFL